ncbi:MAG: MBL fold metallo-hydrolase [Oceanospirillaceae bacterium]|nr:MBL fold metallo-hydrolase [Oceanospirillaceae bacterium]
MNQQSIKLTLGASLVCSGALFSAYLAATEVELSAQQYANRGMIYADEFPGLASLCDIAKPFKIAGQRHKGVKKTAQVKKKKRSKTVLKPLKVFDNLYFVGTGRVSSWVIKTSAGLIVIDALNNNDQAEKYIEKGLIQLGLDPADIKYLIITHGHGDHYGGQEYLVNKYHPKVVMSATEWSILERPELEISNPRWGVRPVRDVSIQDGDTLSLGDTEIQLYVTPGHTPGTLSLIFPVYDQQQKHMVGLWGGTGLNYGPNKARILAYTQSAEKFRLNAAREGVDVFMSNHPGRDGSAQKMTNFSLRLAGETHSYVIGKERVLHAFDLLRDCTRAQAMRISDG